ncbi:MAG TPA: 6-pyruvoyl-tetrahydropterin synthase-related protein [Patescibacteria group bacterium]|nr:6-pyruvoyl-tetrahydropterin synthase-related protein [Patescibacteria group bacterium]
MPERKTFSQKLMSLQGLWGPLGVGLAIIVALTIVLVVFWRIITEEGTVPGADPTSFAHTAKVIVDYFKQTGRFAPIDFTWYAGFEHMQAPPLINYILGGIYYFTNDIWVALRIFQPVAEGLFFLGMFWLLKKDGYPTINAFLGGIFFAFMPTIFNTYGSYTKMVAILFLPLAFYVTNRILTKFEIKNIAYLAVLEALIIYAHPMTGVVFSVFLVGYSTIYAILAKEIQTRRFLFVVFGLFLGILLAGQYIIPFFLEKVGRTAIAAEEATVHVGFLRMLADFRTQIGGTIFALLPLYVIWREKKPKLTALYLMGLFCALAFFGYYYGLGFFFPFSLSYGYIWFFMTGFAFAYLLGLLIPWTRVKDLASYLLRVEIAVCLVIFYLYSANFFIHFTQLINYKNEQFPANFELARALNQIPNDGRVFPSHYPFGMTNWILGTATNKANIEGHYFGISRIGKTIAIMADAIHNSYPDYVVSKLEHLNARFVIANPVLLDMENYYGTKVGEELIKKLEENDYKLVFATRKYMFYESDLDIYRLYYQNRPSTYIMPADEQVLVVGKYAPTLAAAVSPAKLKVLEGGSPYLDDYDQEFLRHFKTVVLYGFSYRDKAKAEAIARNYVQGGGNLVIELFNMGTSPLADNPSFLGVEGVRQKISQKAKLEILADGPLKEKIPQSFDLPGEMYDIRSGALEYRQLNEWNFLEYVGLDESLAKLPNDENMFSILGYKNVKGGKVTFAGMNFFYHLYLSHDQKELAFVSNLLDNQGWTGPSTLDNSKIELKQEKWTPEYLKFKVKTADERLVRISLAYSPHWQGYLDGQPIKVRNMADLMVVQVPPGEHVLEMKYQPTTVSRLALGVTILTGLLLLFLIFSSRYFYFRFKRSEKIGTVNDH